MKMVVAIIQPEKLDDVKEALFEADIHKMTVSRVRGCGQQGGYAESYRGQRRSVNLLEKVRIEIAVTQPFLQKTLDAIVNAAKTGNIGDGKIFVSSLEQCIRIRTSEEGADAVG
jgi:nitrogen regulatory protein P-II 1